MWLVTYGAVAAGPGESPDLAQAPLWGLGRVLGLEQPRWWGGLVDLPPAVGSAEAGVLAGMLTGAEDQIAIRGGVVLGRRLTPAPVPAPVSPGTGWRPRGTVLVTGGTGGIGGQLARWLSRAGAPHLILASRSGPAVPGTQQLRAELAAAGTEVTITACDVSNRDAVARVLAAIPADRPLSAVFHLANSGTGGGVLAQVSPEDLAMDLAAKAGGARVLDELTAGLGLEAFVLFSSGAATFGSVGASGYATANAFLDALAEDRRVRGLPATAIAWGGWAGPGMADGKAAAELTRRGVLLMDPALALDALQQALDHDETLLTVTDMDWARFAVTFTAARPRPLITGIPEAAAALAPDDATPASAAATALAARLTGLPAAGQDQLLTDLVRAKVAAILGHPAPDEIPARGPFSDLGGFDSLTAVELRNSLDAETGLALPTTLIFDYPTPADLARHLRAQITGHEQSEAAAVIRELEKLSDVLPLITAENARTEIISRLRGLLLKFGDASSMTKSATFAGDLESAADEAIFDFIDRDLGVN